MKKIGLIICNRYHTCGGGKCLRAFHQREGAFARYQGEDVQLVGYTTCGGCPGGNVEYVPAEMKKNGADVIHLGHLHCWWAIPPCEHLDAFTRFIPVKYGLEVVIGSHPIPQNYFLTHQELQTWRSDAWRQRIKDTLTDEKTRLAYD